MNLDQRLPDGLEAAQLSRTEVTDESLSPVGKAFLDRSRLDWPYHCIRHVANRSHNVRKKYIYLLEIWDIVGTLLTLIFNK